jgi:hypothetical protein
MKLYVVSLHAEDTHDILGVTVNKEAAVDIIKKDVHDWAKGDQYTYVMKEAEDHTRHTYMFQRDGYVLQYFVKEFEI